jgi:hypothetical protein
MHLSWSSLCCTNKLVFPLPDSATSGALINLDIELLFRVEQVDVHNVLITGRMQFFLILF